MTLKEIKKNFPFSGNSGSCRFCLYLKTCDKILPGLIKPIKCGGPFYKFDEDDCDSQENVCKKQ